MNRWNFLPYAVAGILAICLAPVFRAAHLPLNFAWGFYLKSFCGILTVESLAMAGLFAVVGFPKECWKQLTQPGPSINVGRLIAAAGIPAAFLFAVLVLVFAYNDAIAAMRFDGRADELLNRIDSFLLGGRTTDWFAERLSIGQLHSLAIVYYLLFAVIGATILVLAVVEGLAVSMRFVAAIATSYWIALAAFYFLPATGPYYLATLAGAHRYTGPFVHALEAMGRGQLPTIIGADYFVALPCLHVAQALIVVWFLRRYARLRWMVGAYAVVLVPTVAVLQEHYIIDILAAIPTVIAALAVIQVRDNIAAKGLAGTRKPAYERHTRPGRVSVA